jgi:hypothetical protein
MTHRYKQFVSNNKAKVLFEEDAKRKFVGQYINKLYHSGSRQIYAKVAQEKQA